MNIKSVLLLCFVVLTFTIMGFGQDGQIVGGYGKANVKSAEVIAAAKFAVKTEAKKEKVIIKQISITKARRQVVAGLNYQICMEISYKRKSDKKALKRFVKTVVYRNLKNVYSLTSWEMSARADCSDN